MNEIQKYQPLNDDEKAIIAARQHRIANIEAKQAYKEVLNTISTLFPVYGIDGDFTFFATIAKEIIKTFGQIASNEIEIAFRLFAAEKLDLDEDVKFYGKANMHTIGKILNSYQMYRRKIIAAHDNELAGLRHIEEYEIKKKRDRQDFINNFPNLLKDFKSDNYLDVPVFWFDVATNLGLLEWEQGEKRKLWDEAKSIALLERPDSMDLLSVRSHIRKIEAGNSERAVVIAQKLAVFRKLLTRS